MMEEDLFNIIIGSGGGVAVGSVAAVGSAILLKVVFDYLRFRKNGSIDRDIKKIAETLEKQNDILIEIKGVHIQNTENIRILLQEMRELRGYIVCLKIPYCN